MLLAFGWLLLFAHNGIWAQFSNDDLMNLHDHLRRGPVRLVLDNLRYWSTAYRPLGGLFYVALYRIFGFHPLPFRIACFGLLALNLGLLGRFTFRLSGSREVAQRHFRRASGRVLEPDRLGHGDRNQAGVA